MASRQPQRSSAQRGHGPRQQWRFVTRIDDVAASPSFSSSSSSSSRDRNRTPQNPQPRSLTASLRGGPSPSPSASHSSQAPHEVGAGSGGFMSYLPQDEAVASGFGVEGGGLDAMESQTVVDVLNSELSRLLKMNSREFWKEVACNDGLHESLDSYLQFRNRWYDFPHRGPRGSIAGVIVGEADLSRRVFMVFYRMLSNREHGAHSGGCLNAKEHSALLQKKKILDLPKLLDICAIYGHDNNELTQFLVTSAIRSQPRLIDDTHEALSHFLNIVHTMHQRCSSLVQDLLSSSVQEGQGLHQLHTDLLEVIDFINDAVVTLDAFLDAYRPAAIYLSHPVKMSHGNDELLNVLVRLHDSLIPKLLQGFTCFPNVEVGQQDPLSGDHTSTYLSLKMLSLRTVNVGWKLFDICYLSDELLGYNLNMQNATKIFPSKVEDPVIRGDILVQTFREVSREASWHIQDAKGKLTFFQDIEKKYGILDRISKLRSQGWLYLEDEQFNFLTGLASLPPQLTWKKDQKLPVSAVGDMVQKDEYSVIMESKISQIKDLFPDYGSGFLAACLEVYDHNSEEVIQRILDGTLHEDLLSLETSLEKVPPPMTSQNRNDKGKSVLGSSFPMTGSKGQEVFLHSESHSNLLPSEVGQSTKRTNGIRASSSPLSSHGRYTRKTADDLSETEILDSKSAKDSVRAAILEAHYEDEYDDSFDELGLSVVESGIEEAENSSDKIGSLPEKSPSSESVSSRDSSRWGSRKQPQYYVKDGKNYSYKVSGSVPVLNSEEAELVRQSQKEMIHGLGRGGNLPLGAVKKLMDAEEQLNEESDDTDGAGRGHPSARGRGGRRGGSKHHRKDRATRKAFAGLTTR